MILAIAYDGPLYAGDIRVTSGDEKSVDIPVDPNCWYSFKPRGKAPWTFTIGSSVVAKGVQSEDALVVYRGQEHSVLKSC